MEGLVVGAVDEDEVVFGHGCGGLSFFRCSGSLAVVKRVLGYGGFLK